MQVVACRHPSCHRPPLCLLQIATVRHAPHFGHFCGTMPSCSVTTAVAWQLPLLHDGELTFEWASDAMSSCSEATRPSC